MGSSRCRCRRRRSPSDGLLREHLFTGDDQVLRGRKVYRHQDRLTGQDVSRLANLLRYRPPPDRPTRDSQNATLHGWIKPGTEFRAVLRVDNLHPHELGALLWLLDPHHHGTTGTPARWKLGGGKPLGFGSVEVTLDPARVTLSTGAQIADRLRTLATTAGTSDHTTLAAEFEQAMTPQFGAVLDAIGQAAAGFDRDTDVHYPRNAPTDHGYTWFVENENGRKAGGGQPRRQGRRLSLPPLGKTLPGDPTRP